jgi:hypothetical protein
MARITDLPKIESPSDNNVFPISDGQLTRKLTLLDLKNSIVKQATPTILGSIKVGAGLAVSDTGVLSVRNYSGYTLPPASSEVLGGIRVGSGLTIDDTSVLSVTYSIPVASSTQLGGVKIGSGISINGGIISVESANIAGGALGGIPYQTGTSTTSILPGNITTTKKFLAQTGTGTASRSPFWSTLYNFLPITLYSGQITNISVANGYLPITSRSGAITTITLIS